MPDVQTDLTPYLFLVAIVIVGGIVAWVADGLGRKIGKKRLSFLGLRPRYTATLITVGAGILIPILTILLMYIFSSDVRDWILLGRRALFEAQKNAKIAETLKKDVTGLEQERDNLTGKNRELSSNAQKLTGQLAAQRKNLDETSNKYRLASNRLTSALAKVSHIEGQLTSTNRQIKQKEQELKQTQAELTERRVALKNLISDLNDNKRRALELDRQNVDLERKNQGLERQVNTLDADLTRLRAQKEALEGQVDTYQTSIKRYQEEISSLQEKSQEANARYQNLQNLLNKVGPDLEVSRTRLMIFERGEEVARVQLPPSLSPAAARNAYFDLLQRARAKALERNARKLPNLPSAGILSGRMTDAKGSTRYVTSEEQEAAIIDGLIAERTEIVLIARAFYNTFEGEFVPLDFVAFRNKPVYNAGQVIMETRVDGRKLESEILKAVQQFISENVRAKALRDGMIPPSGTRSSLGTVDDEEILTMVRNLKEENKIVRLQALAKDSTRAGDQLELTFRIRY